MSKVTAPRPDPQAYIYMASAIREAGRTAAAFQASVDNMIRAFEKARATIHSILEQYYFDREAEARWADDGGACDEL